MDFCNSGPSLLHEVFGSRGLGLLPARLLEPLGRRAFLLQPPGRASFPTSLTPLSFPHTLPPSLLRPPGGASTFQKKHQELSLVAQETKDVELLENMAGFILKRPSNCSKNKRTG